MIAYFKKNSEGSFDYFGNWHDKHCDQEDFCKRTILALGHNPEEVKIIHYREKILVNLSFGFSSDMKLVIFSKKKIKAKKGEEEIEIEESVIDREVSGTQLWPKP